MDVNIDVGQQLGGMLQKLADQIGVTVAQIFPWYVQQASLEGIIAVLFLVAGWAIVIPSILFNWRWLKEDDMTIRVAG
jgi:hypothetical protein